MNVGDFYRMARVGLWKELEHNLGTIDVVPIMGLRFVKPISMNRHSKLEDCVYEEYWGGVPHGKHIVTEIGFIDFKVYNLSKRLCVYSNCGVWMMKTSGFKLTIDLDRWESRLKWRKDLITYYRGSGTSRKMRIVKFVLTRYTDESTSDIGDGDLPYIAMDLIKMMESM